ncbi:hypothetical protein [Sutcliffiella horikoshii]|uniref:hypothetical protein n=1 Tax=Sutcliffiella horikoshii TaxID=79883 RepID=UPI001F37FD31|nr:hypothetical protein [Sutcliffiella horikoshii]MCG1023765.1 hypothetical protein [Sutcliffiella horikoshii]
MIEEKDSNSSTEGLMKDSNTLDVDSIMQLATKLMSNKDVIDTFSTVLQPGNSNFSNKKKTHSVSSSGTSDHAGLLMGVQQELINLKTELADLKKQNDELKDLLVKMNESSSKRKKWWNL